MKTLYLLPLDIQLFAEDEGSAANEDVTETSVTDADSENVETTDDTNNVVETDNEQEQSSKTREVKKSTKDYSERLKADREKMRAELEKEQNDRLDRLAKARGFDNWTELEEFSNKQQLEDLGVTDTSAFEKYLNGVIANNPDMIKARAIIAEQQERESQRQLADQVAEISKIDPTIKSINDLVKHHSYDNILERVKAGASVLDAYKLENFDALTGRATDAAVQRTLNNINNKSHVRTTAGSSITNDIVVPSDIYAGYKKNLPNWTDEQIKQHYAKEMVGDI